MLVGPEVGPLVGPNVGPLVGPEVGPEVGPLVGPLVGPVHRLRSSACGTHLPSLLSRPNFLFLLARSYKRDGVTFILIATHSTLSPAEIRH